MSLEPVAPRAVPLSLRTKVLAPIRAGVSLVGLCAALLTGERSATALLAWAVGTGIALIVFWGDPRGRRPRDPDPLPLGARIETWGEIARTDVFPSTVGVTVMMGIALVFDAVLAAFLAGILGGMALMTIASRVTVARLERRHAGTLYVERRTKRLFVEPKRQH
jgi:hypothetical protein